MMKDLATYSPDVAALFNELTELHMRKSADYANVNNPFSNFEAAAQEAGVDVDTVFRVIIAIKTARIAELESSGKEPSNEALRDSYVDRVMYSILQLAYRDRAARKSKGYMTVIPDMEPYGHGV